MDTCYVPSPNDLLIVGAGHLGCRIAQQWRKLHTDATIVGETKTDSSHSTLRDIGISPVLADSSSTTQFPNVVFCVPPRKVVNYGKLVEAAANRAKQKFVFTSSTSVYGSAKSVTEKTPTGDQEKTAILRHAEESALQFDISLVIRFTGLYSLERGPHIYWSENNIASGNEKAKMNVVHYDDAASAVVRALCLPRVPERPVLLIGAPETPTRRQVLDCLLQHPVYKDVVPREFVNEEPYFERRIDGSWSNHVLNWRPVYSSYAHFLELDAERVRASSLYHDK